MFLIGLTGGIAAGKSTVAKCWRDLGAIEIDADQVARDVVAAGSEGLGKIVHEFGDGILNADGGLNRSALAAIVFADPESRLKLEGILHPLIRKRSNQLINDQKPDSMVVYTVPLLVEAEVDLPFDAVVTVEAPYDEQVRRLVESRGLTVEEAKSRIAAQASSAARATRADYILNSNQPLPDLLADATNLWVSLRRMAEVKG